MRKTETSDNLPENHGGVRVFTPAIQQLKEIKHRTGFSQGRTVTAVVDWVSKCPPEFMDLILGRLSEAFRPKATEIAKEYLDSLLKKPDHAPRPELLPVGASGAADPQEYLNKKRKK